MSRDEVERQHAEDDERWRERIAALRSQARELCDDSFEILEAAHAAYHLKLESLRRSTGTRWEAVREELDRARAHLEQAWVRVLQAIG